MKAKRMIQGKKKIYAITAKNVKLASTQFLKLILLNPLYLELVKIN